LIVGFVAFVMKTRWIVLVLAIAVAGVVAAIVFYSRSEEGSAPTSADRIKIEMRAMPTATIFIAGKKIGVTPMSLQYPPSTRELVIEAVMTRHSVRRGGKKDEIYKAVRKVTLDRDHLLDFTLDTATLIETNDQVTEPRPK
jgi:hypothetical protein